jgi:hypothetical protein
VQTWDEYYRMVGAAAGVELQLVHIPADFVGAWVPDSAGGPKGDKAVSAVFDSTKIKRRTLAWFDADPARRQIDVEVNARLDKLIAV